MRVVDEERESVSKTQDIPLAYGTNIFASDNAIAHFQDFSGSIGIE